MSNRLTSWFIFSVIVGLLPIFANILVLYNKDAKISIDIIIGKGELFLFICAISAATIGELMASNNEFLKSKIIAGGAATIILFLSAFQFADISATLYAFQQSDGNSTILATSKLNSNSIARSSLWLLLFSIIVSGISIAIASIRPVDTYDAEDRQLFGETK